MKSISLTKTSFWLLVFYALIPIATITNFYIGFAYIDASKLALYTILGIILYSYVRMGLKSSYSAFVLYTLLLFATHIAAGVSLGNHQVSTVLRHAEFYLPFIASILLISSKITWNREKFEIWIYWGITSSAIIALAAHFLTNEWLQNKLKQYNEELAYTSAAGRMHWDSAALTLIAIFLFFSSARIYRNKGSIIGLAITLTALLTTQNRTLVLASIALFVFYFKIRPKTILSTIFISIGLLFAFSQLPEKTQSLFLTRFFLDGAASEFERAFEIGRLGLYEQYTILLKEHPILGSMLGSSLSYNHISDIAIYTSDISLISFWVPFGIFGLGLILHFWHQLYSGIKKIKLPASSIYKKNLAILLTITILASFNVDLFSRNKFVLILVALIFNTTITPKFNQSKAND